MHESPEHRVMHQDVKSAGEITLLPLMNEKLKSGGGGLNVVSPGPSTTRLRHLHAADYKSHFDSKLLLHFFMSFQDE